MNESQPSSIRKLGPMSAFICSSRWLQLPLYLGLIAAHIVVVYHFWVELVHLLEAVFGSQTSLQAVVSSIGYKADIQVMALDQIIVIHVVFLLSALAIACTDRLMSHTGAGSSARQH
jgi:uncharacterized membrane protein YqhA